MPLAQARWRRAALTLRGKLTDFAEGDAFTVDAVAAQELYFSRLQQNVLALDEDFLIERCFEWFIFDYRFEDNQTMIDRYRESCGHNLSLTEALLLVQWGEARSSLYEIKGVLPRRGLLLDDLFSGQSYRVREPGIRTTVLPGSVINVRLLKTGNEYEFSTSAIGVPPGRRDALLQWVLNDYRHWLGNTRDANGANLKEYLSREAHVLNARVIQMGVLGTQTTEGMSSGHPSPERSKGGRRRALRPVGGKGKGREQVEELLGMVLGMERDGNRPASPPPLHAFEGYGESISGDYKVVAQGTGQGLVEMGFGRDAVQSALRLWCDYCAQVHPRLSKPAAWIAALVYNAAQLGGDRSISQAQIAQRYGVAPSTVSHHSRVLAAFRPESDSDQPRQEGKIRGIEPLVDRILFNLKI